MRSAVLCLAPALDVVRDARLAVDAGARITSDGAPPAVAGTTTKHGDGGNRHRRSNKRRERCRSCWSGGTTGSPGGRQRRSGPPAGPRRSGRSGSRLSSGPWCSWSRTAPRRRRCAPRPGSGTGSGSTPAACWCTTFTFTRFRSGCAGATHNSERTKGRENLEVPLLCALQRCVPVTEAYSLMREVGQGAVASGAVLGIGALLNGLGVALVRRGVIVSTFPLLSFPLRDRHGAACAWKNSTGAPEVVPQVTPWRQSLARALSVFGNVLLGGTALLSPSATPATPCELCGGTPSGLRRRSGG